MARVDLSQNSYPRTVTPMPPGPESPVPRQLRNDRRIPLVTAVWKDTTIASSGETVVVEGYHYFPPSTVDLSLLEMSPHTSICPDQRPRALLPCSRGRRAQRECGLDLQRSESCRGGYPGSYRLLERGGGRLISLPGSTGDPMTHVATAFSRISREEVMADSFACTAPYDRASRAKVSKL